MTRRSAFQTQGGKIRARGLELEARGALTEQFSVIGSYTLQQVKYTQDTQGREGKTPLHVLRTFGALWLDWQAPAGTEVKGLGVAVGGVSAAAPKEGPWTVSLTPGVMALWMLQFVMSSANSILLYAVAKCN
ncbi:TPA: TonB-dependent receptor [Klebsiella pneumoniae]|nr:TonB-dependent receptor [Klebsiella pneumoniae subsp. ozaenae]HDH0768833.1 TonB-dependent receptor [Klebsiella pneumoniae]